MPPRLYIALPFLLEALVTALIGVVLAGAALAAFMWFGVQRAASADSSTSCRGSAGRSTSPRCCAIAILGPLLTLVPTLVLTRKYLKV